MSESEDEKNTLFSAPDPDNYVEDTKSLGEYCIQRLRFYGNSVVLINGHTGEELSADKLLRESIRVAECLLHNGLRAGDTVGLCSENRFEFAYVMFGTFMAGLTLTTINSSYTERELHHTMNLSKPKIIFSSPMSVKRVLGANQGGFIEKIICFPDVKSTIATDDFIDYDSFVRNPKIKIDVSTFQCQPQNINEAVALILYSSGTTGLPKGVELTQNNIFLALTQMTTRPKTLEEKLVPNLIAFSVLPWFHTYGFHALMAICLSNFKLVFLSKYEDRLFLSAIEKYKANTCYLVPPNVVFLAKNPIVDQYDLSSVKVVWSGAAPLSKELEDAVKKRLNLPIIRQGYGMTEGTTSFTRQSDGYQKPGSVGTVNSGLWARVLDVDTGRPLGPFAEGELVFKGPGNMKGYIGDPVATNNIIDKNGWLHTGDIAYYDNDKEIFIVDRLKELIKYNGFQVPPAEIEGILLQNPKVRDAAVIGVPNEKAGELPMAFVVKQANAEISEKEIIDFVAANTSTPKQLHGGVRFVASIPKNPSGKILRRELRNLFKNSLAKL